MKVYLTVLSQLPYFIDRYVRIREPQIVEVERELTRWQRFRMEVGGVAAVEDVKATSPSPAMLCSRRFPTKKRATWRKREAGCDFCRILAVIWWNL